MRTSSRGTAAATPSPASTTIQHGVPASCPPPANRCNSPEPDVPTNDSSTGGYLSPVVASSALQDAALDALLQQMVAGITGLPGNMVRPRWQPVTPKQPE